MSPDSTHLVQRKAPGLGLENMWQSLQLLWALSSLDSCGCLFQSRSMAFVYRFLAGGGGRTQTLGGLRTQ